MRPAPRTRSLASLLLVLGGVSCVAPRADLEQRPTFSLHAALADDYEVEQTVPESLPGGAPLGGQGIDGDVDYTSLEAGAGATTFQYVGPPPGSGVPEGAPIYRRKLARLEARVGYASFEDADGTELQALELAAGGRAFTPLNAGVAPYLGALPTVTIFEDASGISVGAQLGLRLGVGVEVDLTRWMALDLGLDYALPLVELGPGSVLGEDADTEFEGAAARLGLLITL